MLFRSLWRACSTPWGLPPPATPPRPIPLPAWLSRRPRLVLGGRRSLQPGLSIHHQPSLETLPLPPLVTPVPEPTSQTPTTERAVPTGCAPALQVIAMHGWSGEASHWTPWCEAFAARGWSWQSGERGYGGARALSPSWQDGGRRVVIAHSMGPHLLPSAVLAAAEAVVLLASFGRFVPPGAPGRRLRSALDQMARQLDAPASARAMLHTFLREAAAPESAELLPPGPADGPLGEIQRQRLRRDLELLGRTTGLPDGFPDAIPVLVVEAAQDRIVVPEARQLLRRDLETQRNLMAWLTLRREIGRAHV